MSSKLKVKFVQHLQLRGLAWNTQKIYLDTIKGLAVHYNQSPDELTNEQVHEYLKYLLLEKKSPVPSFVIAFPVFLISTALSWGGRSLIALGCQLNP